MNVIKIYKTELYKMCKRKINLILLVPSVLALLIALGYGSGNLKFEIAGEQTQVLYSCLDFLMMVWTFISGTGLYAIIIILIAAYQFSAEIEQGQIKMMLLRIGGRHKLIIGKILSLLTLMMTAVLIFILTVIASYYLYLVPVDAVSGTFDVSMMNLQNSDLFGTIGVSVTGFIIFSFIAYLLGLKGNPFMTFIFTLIMMFVTKSMAQIESLSFMKYTPFYLENQYMMGLPITQSTVVTALLVAATLMITLFGLTTYRFNKVDIK